MEFRISLCLLSVLPVFAFAGPSSSGGGPSIICRGTDKKIQTAQLLDLYEGQVRYGLTIPKSDVPAQAQLKQAFERLKGFDWFIASDVADALKQVESKISHLPEGVIMAPGVDLGDSYAALIPDGCELAYVGYYESDGTLRISQTIYDHLSQTDRAALFMHEALYVVARNLASETNSLPSREINAYLFSSTLDLSRLKLLAGHVKWRNPHDGWISGTTGYVTPPVMEPVMFAVPQQAITVEVTGPSTNDSRAYMSCFDWEGKETNLTYGDSATGSYLVEGCRLFSLETQETASFDPGARIIVKYGNQVVVNEGFNQLMDLDHTAHGVIQLAFPIYFTHELTLPNQPI